MSGSSPAPAAKMLDTTTSNSSRRLLSAEEVVGAEKDWEEAKAAYESLASTKRPRPVRQGGRFAFVRLQLGGGGFAYVRLRVGGASLSCTYSS